MSKEAGLVFCLFYTILRKKYHFVVVLFTNIYSINYYKTNDSEFYWEIKRQSKYGNMGALKDSFDL